ncbi:neutral zinc metallopeptidase [Saccharomonospora sp. NPDC046836]|uniref:neutral zinc metallopeptidase n=1 Tax=Saccharomonospora sp. NPDC046836 TaxID=3156921 RepID=UPI00340FF93F
MGVAGDDPDRAAERPFIEDLPLSLWEPAKPGDPADPAPPKNHRPRRPPWRRALPIVVSVALVAVLVVVVTELRGRSGDPADTEPGQAVGARQEPAQSLTDNRLHRAAIALPPVTCHLPELAGAQAALHAYYTAEIACLDAAWRPALEQSGAAFAPVSVELADNPVTQCGELPPAAEATGLYCHADATIYLPRARVLASLGLGTDAHLATVAHEYGHHVQELAGILDLVNSELSRYEPGSAKDRELGRRVELQANCFAGLFLASAAGRGAITAADARAAVDDFRNWVDSESHGTSEAQLRWANTGFTARTVAACDTWNAPSATVE